jgi:hypothetical protein
MTVERSERRLLALAVGALFLLHLPFLPATLDDIDAINFDLGIHDYDPVAHRPHPPGYPVFIALAKLVHPFVPSHAAAIALLSAVFGALSVIPLYLLARELVPKRGAALACLLTLICPLVWFNSVRPMSDVTGLFFVLVSQCLILTAMAAQSRGAVSGRALWLAGVTMAGLAAGVRVQALILVGPILLVGAVRFRSAWRASVACLTVSLAVWIVPLLLLSGGPAAYLNSAMLLVQDALPAEPLLSAPGLRRAVFGAWDVLGSPWGPPWLGVPMLALAAIGGLVMLRWNRRTLGWALLLFAPHAVYHYLFQFTPAIRYAIPVVPLVSVLAAGALTSWRPARASVVVAAGLVVFTLSASWTWPALLAYHRHPGPAAQAIERLRLEAAAGDFVVTGHHVFARYLSALSSDFTVLNPGPERVWRALADYWKGGGRQSVLFLKDPMRITLLRMARDARIPLGQWDWPAPVIPLMKGERPLSVQLLRLDPPSWFSDSGFLITPEAGAPDQVARRPHRAFVRPSPRRRVLIASGPLGAPQPPITLRVGESVEGRWQLAGDFFTLVKTLDPVTAVGYVPLTFESASPILFTDLWVDSVDRPVIRPARGFFMPERDDHASLFRWIAPTAQALVYVPAEGARLRLRGRIPIKYYELPVTITLAWNGAPLASVAVSERDFEIECPLPGPTNGQAWATVTITSSQQFVPDARLRNGDHRTLSAQVFEMTVVASEQPPGGSPGPGVLPGERNR